MKNILNKIYQDVLVYEKDIVKGNRQVDDLLKQLIEPYNEQLTDTELETLNELLSAVALTAEQAGFENGVKFVIKMLYSLFND